MKADQKVRICSWGLAAFVTVLAIAVWVGERFPAPRATLYILFPLLALLAFSLMWSHYVAGSLRRYYRVEAAVNKTFYKVTSVVVLALILLHPGLLIFQLWRDGFGLPPNSYVTVYALPAMKGALMLGTISLMIFLAFELKYRFGKKQWWKYVEYAQIVAMLFIFYHGLTLGRELAGGRYRTVWYFYGVSLVTAIFYNYWYDNKIAKEVKSE